ncbi:LMBRD2 [Bugula neritina]|uniref:LMBRD2 n=1 Tax=Bugula neritina TaxID=10212 RepID=A0A7J7JPI6_BUGNE|nr:LMBRD2 [Bugula neritina]
MADHFAVFVLGLLAVFAVSLFTLYSYSNIRKQHVIVTVATLIAWYSSFIIVFILPLDISATKYKQCQKDHNCSLENSNNIHETDPHHGFLANMTTVSSPSSCPCVEPWSWVPQTVLSVFWKIVYWGAQVLTWLVLPIMNSYASAGEFTVIGKLKSAIIANLIYYATYVVIFCICLIYLATQPYVTIDLENLKVIGITASNTWGLFLLVLLYGYGLVDIPRSIWQSSHTLYMLQQTYFKVAKVTMEYSEAQEKYDDTLEDVRRSVEVIKYNHPFRKYVDTILSKCPRGFPEIIAKE